jgi:hypothetical protein
MPVYRASAQAFVVRYADLPIERRTLLMDRGRYLVLRGFLDGLDEAMEKQRDCSFRFAQSEGVNPMISTQYAPGDQAGHDFGDSWMSLRLNADDAKELASRMRALLVEYEGKSGRGAYLAHAGVVREPRLRIRSINDPE